MIYADEGDKATRLFAVIFLHLFFFLYLMGSVCVIAEEDAAEADEGDAASVAIYLPLKPQFVVNYGGIKGKLRYLKAAVTIRLSDPDTASSVRHHMPFIRNKLVMLFASQSDETLQSQEGREAMRQTALTEIRELLLLEEEVAPETIVDVLFNSLTWH